MSASSELKLFLENIMQVNVVHMGGARAGIIGSSDANNDVVSNLKKSAIDFAQEYRKQNPSQAILIRTSEQVSGYLQTLQLTNTLSESTVSAFIDELEKLMDKASV